MPEIMGWILSFYKDALRIKDFDFAEEKIRVIFFFDQKKYKKFCLTMKKSDSENIFES